MARRGGIFGDGLDDEGGGGAMATAQRTAAIGAEGLFFTANQDALHADQWRAEARAPGGQTLGALFYGPAAEMRARAYCDLVNAQGAGQAAQAPLAGRIGTPIGGATGGATGPAPPGNF